MRAAVIETAGAGNVRPCDLENLALVIRVILRRIEIRYRSQKKLCVRVLCVAVDGLGGSLLHDPAAVHNRDAVAQIVLHVQVVGDEEHREICACVDFIKQVENLGAYGYVKSGGRFIRDDKVRLQHKRSADAYALSLPAGELSRIAVRVGGIESDLFQHDIDRFNLLLLCADLMRAKGLPHGISDCLSRIQGA